MEPFIRAPQIQTRFIQGQIVFHEKLIKKCVHHCANIDHYLHLWSKKKKNPFWVEGARIDGL